MPTSGRVPATRKDAVTPQNYAQALSLMEMALGIIDRHDGPTDAGAHLDLAIDRLKGWIEVNRH